MKKLLAIAVLSLAAPAFAQFPLLKKMDKDRKTPTTAPAETPAPAPAKTDTAADARKDETPKADAQKSPAKDGK